MASANSDVAQRELLGGNEGDAQNDPKVGAVERISDRGGEVRGDLRDGAVRPLRHWCVNHPLFLDRSLC